MVASKESRLQKFVRLFNALKQATSNDPNKLVVYYSQSSSVRGAADELFWFAGLSDFERRVFHGAKKYHVQAPAEFESLWQEFNNRWRSKLADVAIDLSGIFPGESESADEQFPVLGVESPDPDHEDEFDPVRHDGGKAFKMAHWITESYAEEVGGASEDTIHRASNIGLEAIEYLTGTIGLDASEVFRRWRQIPIVFMPAHVSDHHGLTERGSLHDLLDNAVRAYVFGATAAAMAMCRAVLEILLKEHFDIDYQYRDHKGRPREKGLGELIVLADQKYEFFQGKRVKRLTDKANEIVHRYTSRQPVSVEDEKNIIEFMKTLKYLIERAP